MSNKIRMYQTKGTPVYGCELMTENAELLPDGTIDSPLSRYPFVRTGETQFMGISADWLGEYVEAENPTSQGADRKLRMLIPVLMGEDGELIPDTL